MMEEAYEWWMLMDDDGLENRCAFFLECFHDFHHPTTSNNNNNNLLRKASAV